ncbi:MAG: hypothetical protein Greene07147_297 [Parcubacteria group bacterium Greene0714_7]|nr:MAG: hypothetical protein Greene07147_297 [Parcubacteria group bacterium Greene0714_7]
MGYDLVMHFVYIIRNSANKIYTGVTKNPQQRLHYHNEKRGAQFTKRTPTHSEQSRGTYKIVFLEKYLTLADARKREIQIKKWKREKKETLIAKYQEGLPTKT